ncbi:hypothetical protein FJZ31_20750 [Candidatus Poribacteria bacterium]|nr:hypothetical protein [Candidatus Poribacteria bacterium]
MNQNRFSRNKCKSILFVCFICLLSVAVINTANADAKLSASITASNNITGSSVVSVGQTITVTMTVTNTGDAVANDVMPSELKISGDGIASKTSGSIPPKANIPAGKAQDFTLTYNADAAGVVNFSGTASGTGAVGEITSPAATSNNVTIQIPATLEIIGITAGFATNPIPTQVNVGQTITIEMKVKNQGQATAQDVKPSVTPSGSGGVSYSAGPVPPNANLKAGEELTFLWIYKAGSPGTVTFSGMASGVDVNSSQSVSTKVGETKDVIIQTPATLSITAFTAGNPGNPITSQITEGQEITITMTVANTGQATVNNVVPTVQKRPDSTGNATYVSGPEPASVNIESGKSITFTWVYSTKEGNAGDVLFSGRVTGKDFNTGMDISAEGVSNRLVIQTPPKLIASLNAEHPGNAIPTQISEGQTITVTMTVQNTGGATTKGVKPSELQVAGNATLASSPSPSEIDIPGGKEQTYTWIYNTTTGSAGPIKFSGCASGADFNSGAPVKTSDVTSNAVTVQIPTHLEITSLTAENPENPIKTQISEGQSIIFTMSVKNSGQATAKDVYITPFWPGPGTAKLTNPTPEKATIAGVGEQKFTWSWTTTSGNAGTPRFTASATGTDFNSNITDDVHVSSAYLSDITIQTPAKLSLSSVKAEHPGNPNPSEITEGQTITVTMSVMNTGQATATDVRVDAPSWPGTGKADLTSSPEPSSVAIPGGGSQNFTWIWTTAPGTAGTVQFSGRVTGKDYNSRTEKSSAGTSNSVLIQTPPKLSATIDARHPGNEIETQISEGQTITVVMTVTNDGDETANNVTPPEQLSTSGSGNATYESGPEPKSASIGGHSSTTFEWTYTTADGNHGNVTFSGYAVGIGYNTGYATSTPEATSNLMTIQIPAFLEITSLTAGNPGNPKPDQVSEGQSITLTMIIKNSGEAKAVKVTPTAKLLTGNLTVSTIPSPMDIKGGESETFIWVYNTGPRTSGTVLFSVSALGTDFNSKETKSASQISNSVLIQKPANISISSFTAERPGNPIAAQISEGQTIICTVIVTNNGEATANSVKVATPTWPGFGSANLIFAPSPSSSDIEGGKSVSYTWTWETKTGTAGSIIFSANASGTDFNSGATTTADKNSNPMLIQTPPNLKVTLNAEHEGNRKPAQVSEGQEITVTMTVANSGQAKAINVTPSTQLQINGAGNAIYKSGPEPASVTINGGESKLFRWIYSTTTGYAGEITFSGKSSGYDFNSNEYIPAPDNTSNSVLIQIPAVLRITKFSAGNPDNPKVTQISEGQNIIVTMTVENTGQATAVGVNLTPKELKLEGNAIGNIGSIIISPDAKDIDGGKSGDFRWIYATKRVQNNRNYEVDDTIAFKGSVTGEDYNSREPKATEPITSNKVVIQMPAALKAEGMDLSAVEIYEKQSFEVKLRVRNSGEADAENVKDYISSHGYTRLKKAMKETSNLKHPFQAKMATQKSHYDQKKALLRLRLKRQPTFHAC